MYVNFFPSNQPTRFFDMQAHHSKLQNRIRERSSKPFASSEEMEMAIRQAKKISRHSGEIETIARHILHLIRGKRVDRELLHERTFSNN